MASIELKEYPNKTGNINFLVIHNDSAAFNPEEFHELATERLCQPFQSPCPKYVAVGDELFISAELEYYPQFFALRAEGIRGRVQSAGLIICGGFEWMLFGFLPKLALNSHLSRLDSDSYRNTVIKEKFGPFFQTE